MKTIYKLILGCLVVTAPNIHAKTCVLESLTSNPVLTDQCEDSVDLDIDAKTIDMDHMAVSNKVVINLPEGQIDKEIELLNNSIVLLDWFKSQKVNGKNSKEHAISIETVNYSGVPYFILQRPEKMQYATDIRSNYVIVPSANLVYSDKSSAIRATCKVGTMRWNLRNLFVPMANADELFQRVDADGFWNPIANFEIRYLLNMQGKKYSPVPGDDNYAAVSVKHSNSVGPEIALLNLTKLAALTQNRICEVSHLVNPNIRIAAQVKPEAVVETVKSEEINQNQEVLQKSNRRGD